jgi:hypothetical protein
MNISYRYKIKIIFKSFSENIHLDKYIQVNLVVYFISIGALARDNFLPIYPQRWHFGVAQVDYQALN